MGLAIEHLRIHALPPFSLAVRDGLHSIVRSSCKWSGRIAFITNRKKLIPRPVRRSVIAHSKTQAIGTGDLGPRAHDVALPAYIGAIPRLMFRIPAVEVIVVSSESNQILGSSTFVQID